MRRARLVRLFLPELRRASDRKPAAFAGLRLVDACISLEMARLMRDPAFVRKVSDALGGGRFPATIEHEGRRIRFTRFPPGLAKEREA